VTKRAVIVGAGISGLAAAYRLYLEGLRSAEELEVFLLEERAAAGGKVRTTRNEAGVFEEGPGSFLDPGPALKELIAISGIELIRASEEAARRHLCHGRSLHELSPHPWRLFKTGLLSAGAIFRIFAESWVGTRRSDHGNRPTEGWGDESVEAFITRRFGPKAASLFAAPMVSGVFAGDPKKLSLKACFPKIAAMEAEHGSVIKAMRSRRRAGASLPLLQAPKAGMQSLPNALIEKAPFKVKLSTSVTQLSIAGDRWSLNLKGQDALDADAIVIATPCAAASELLREVSPAASLALSKVSSPHLAVVNLIYAEDEARRVPLGFGALHTADSGTDLLGVLHESHIFPQRRSDGCLHLRVMLGGATKPDLGGLSDEALLQTVERDLQAIHGFKTSPTATHITRWNQSIPQYQLGHSRLLEDMSQALEASKTPPIALAGNYLRGVSLSDTAAAGFEGADSILRQLKG
jgi:oxygen-dependent protoporphyrinogen oxidase